MEVPKKVLDSVTLQVTMRTMGSPVNRTTVLHENCISMIEETEPKDLNKDQA